jgi:hypothetical protein
VIGGSLSPVLWIRIRIILFGKPLRKPISEKPDPDLHQSDSPDFGSASSEKTDPDPDADPQQCLSELKSYGQSSGSVTFWYGSGSGSWYLRQ